MTDIQKENYLPLLTTKQRFIENIKLRYHWLKYNSGYDLQTTAVISMLVAISTLVFASVFLIFNPAVAVVIFTQAVTNIIVSGITILFSFALVGINSINAKVKIVKNELLLEEKKAREILYENGFTESKQNLKIIHDEIKKIKKTLRNSFRGYGLISKSDQDHQIFTYLQKLTNELYDLEFNEQNGFISIENKYYKFKTKFYNKLNNILLSKLDKNEKTRNLNDTIKILIQKTDKLNIEKKEIENKIIKIKRKIENLQSVIKGTIEIDNKITLNQKSNFLKSIKILEKRFSLNPNIIYKEFINFIKSKKHDIKFNIGNKIIQASMIVAFIAISSVITGSIFIFFVSSIGITLIFSGLISLILAIGGVLAGSGIMIAGYKINDLEQSLKNYTKTYFGDLIVFLKSKKINKIINLVEEFNEIDNIKLPIKQDSKRQKSEKKYNEQFSQYSECLKKYNNKFKEDTTNLISIIDANTEFDMYIISINLKTYKEKVSKIYYDNIKIKNDALLELKTNENKIQNELLLSISKEDNKKLILELKKYMNLSKAEIFKIKLLKSMMSANVSRLC